MVVLRRRCISRFEAALTANRRWECSAFAGHRRPKPGNQATAEGNVRGVNVWRGLLNERGLELRSALLRDSTHSAPQRASNGAGAQARWSHGIGRVSRLVRTGILLIAEDPDNVLAPRCIAKDLVEAVGAKWTGHALDHILAEYRGMVSVTTLSGAQKVVYLSEAGMNMYLFRFDDGRAKWNGAIST